VLEVSSERAVVQLVARGLAGQFAIALPVQVVDATPSSALIRKCFRGRTISFAVLGQNLARVAFRLI